MRDFPKWCRDCLYFVSDRCRKNVKPYKDSPCNLYRSANKGKRSLMGSLWPPRWADVGRNEK